MLLAMSPSLVHRRSTCRTRGIVPLQRCECLGQTLTRKPLNASGQIPNGSALDCYKIWRGSRQNIADMVIHSDESLLAQLFYSRRKHAPVTLPASILHD